MTENYLIYRKCNCKSLLIYFVLFTIIIVIALNVTQNGTTFKINKKLQNSNLRAENTRFSAIESSVTETKSPKFQSEKNVTSVTKIKVVSKTIKNSQPITAQIYTTEEPFTVFKYEFELLTNLQEKCKQNESVDVVFLIVSFIKTYDRRMAIRETWGLENHIKDAKIRRVFLMGTDPKNDSVRTEILRENDQFHDIVLADYADTYENNTIKYIMGINWARKFCSNSKFYVIADDDAFVSVKNLLKYLLERKLYDNHAKFENIYLATREQQHRKFYFYGGYLLQGAPPMRDGKWKATLQQYPYDVYPNYVTGHTVILSRDVLDVFVEAAHHTKFFWIDDVYLGMLAAWADVTPTHVNHIEVGHPTDIKIFDITIASHYIPNATETIRIWNLINARGNA